MPVVDLPDDDVVAPSAQGEDGNGRMAEMAALRDEIVERVERRPLFVMAEERNVPYFRLFFMTKPELLEAILEVEHVPPHDVLPSPEALERVREIAAEAYRRNAGDRGRGSRAQGPGLSLTRRPRVEGLVSAGPC